MPRNKGISALLLSKMGLYHKKISASTINNIPQFLVDAKQMKNIIPAAISAAPVISR